MTGSLEAVMRAICNSRGLVPGVKIGEGAFKDTYLVRTTYGEPRALKVVREGCSIERTMREVEAMKKCDHPGIAKLHDVSSIGYCGRTYVFMLEEYIAGGTLTDCVRDSMLTPCEARTIGLQLIHAIAHIASHDLVHRDLKPANIMLRKHREEPVVLDFGLVRDLRKESITWTWLRQGPCTPYFASPEQLNNDKDLIDWRTDQFALGLVVAVCTLGVHPYERSGDSDADIVDRIAERESPSTEFLTRATEIGLPVIARMVRPWPAERYRTPRLLMEAWSAQQ